MNARRVKRNWDIVELQNGVILRNGAVVHYCLSGTILKKAS